MSITGRGKHSRSRRRLRLREDQHGKIDIKRALQTFKSGDRVLIDPNPAIQKNIPHRRFFGIGGTISDKKGHAYTILINDGKKTKAIDIMPAHLKRL